MTRNHVLEGLMADYRARQFESNVDGLISWWHAVYRKYPDEFRVLVMKLEERNTRVDSVRRRLLEKGH